MFAELKEATPLRGPPPNYRAHVLDRHLNPVPSEVVGELYIGGGDGARGYLRRPALTSRAVHPGR